MLAACLKEQLSLQAGARSCRDLPGHYVEQASEVAYLRGKADGTCLHWFHVCLRLRAGAGGINFPRRHMPASKRA